MFFFIQNIIRLDELLFRGFPSTFRFHTRFLYLHYYFFIVHMKIVSIEIALSTEPRLFFTNKSLCEFISNKVHRKVGNIKRVFEQFSLIETILFESANIIQRIRRFLIETYYLRRRLSRILKLNFLADIQQTFRPEKYDIFRMFAAGYLIMGLYHIGGHCSRWQREINFTSGAYELKPVAIICLFYDPSATAFRHPNDHNAVLPPRSNLHSNFARFEPTKIETLRFTSKGYDRSILCIHFVYHTHT